MINAMPLAAMREFFKMEAAGGIVLVLASAIAIVIANSWLAQYYELLLGLRLQIRLADAGIDKPLLLWINDGLMAIFFLLVGLEIKRELVEGELSSREQAILPAIGALGGMLVPAVIYLVFNFGHPESLNGWAIPAATDIAFSLGVLSLLGPAVPLALKVLLTAIAIFDDLGAIVIIALFYTSNLSLASLGLAALALLVLFVLNSAGVRTFAPYVLAGAVLWVCVLKSGVHATLTGVAVAAAIPLKADLAGFSPLRRMEHGLHPWVAFGILPVFAFANAGVSFAGIGWAGFLQPITLGIAFGLFIGKQIGIFGSIWLAERAGVARVPPATTRMQLYGVAILCGIGFTMSLFIGGLAWDHSRFDAPVRLGVLTGSVLSAIVGAALLSVALRTGPSAFAASSTGKVAADRTGRSH
jgi:NhaA family Na+:H+ antiporter